MITILAKILKALNSEQAPSQLAIAILLAMIVGFTPLFSLHNLLILLLLLFVRVNISIFIVSYPLFAIIGWLISPLINTIGNLLLENDFLSSFWQYFYNTLIGRWSEFNFSGVVGGLSVAIVMGLVLYPFLIWGIVKYRNQIYQKMKNSKFMVAFKATHFWRIYEKISG